MGRLRTMLCRSGQEVCVELEETLTVQEMRQKVLATLGHVQATKQPLAGARCLASNAIIADLLGLKADVLVPARGFRSSRLLQPWSFDTAAVQLGTFQPSDKASDDLQMSATCPLWGVEAISFVETQHGQGYVLFGSFE